MKRKKNRFIEQSDNKFLQIARDFDEVCPSCNSIHISVRKRKIPKYRCQYCGKEFDNPKETKVYQTPKQKREYHMQYSNPDE